ncbi:MAG: hypothetical protein M1837_000071 [Sclerophora amabilis]|nr:MAG: hypothetical protein M1837_000071 [Sclerophora amabilis]
MSTATKRNPDGVRPAVIPQAVEFPYPRSSGDSSRNGPIPSTETKGLSRPERRPRLARKAVTEQPSPRRRSSKPALKKTTTGGSTALNEAVWTSGLFSDSDSLSSSGSETEQYFQRKRSRHGSKSNTRKSNAIAGDTKDADTEPYSRFAVGNDEYKTRGKVSKRDGRLNITVSEITNSGYLAKALGATLKHHLGPGQKHETEQDGIPYRSASPSPDDPETEAWARPKLNIVIMVIGSRGDIQPFLQVGRILKEEHGHRVRIATHPAFKKFVEQDTGLDFFSVGGDPAELMAFMVKNPGLVPSLSTVRAGEIGRRRDQMFEMFQGFWRACINSTDDETDLDNIKMMGNKRPFIADAIIANPPCFAHIHCAEKLGVPLHLMFTFPYSPTQKFPHPLANIKNSNINSNYTNFMSYPLVEMMTWQGLGDLVNRFRTRTLGLEPVSTLWAPGQLYRLKVPYTYLWSPGLVPKPPDWGPEIDIAGFVFLDLASSFEPPDTLTQFLNAGPPPVYIGFGSIVVDDPNKFTAIIFEAVQKAGVRAIVSKGWGGLGDDNVPDGIYMLGNTPHDWLFPRVAAVVHHGGAGTTAIGLKCGKPTMIVPFFGDQPFWGSMCARARAGSHEPVPYKQLTADRLARGIRECLSEEASTNAATIANEIAKEGDGARNAVKSFHRSLTLRGDDSMRCAILEDRVAVWNLKDTNLRLSALAADILVARKKLAWKNLRLIRHKDWSDFAGPGEPFTGAGAALLSSATGVARGFGGVPIRWVRKVKRHGEQRREKRSTTKADSHEESNGTSGRNSHSRGQAPDLESDEADDRVLSSEEVSETSTPRSDEANGAVRISNNSSKFPKSPEDCIAQDMAAETGRGLEKSGKALAKAPMNLSLAVAQGFHNAPRLYGDETVRRPRRISGIHSGMRAAGSEFVYGIYDGVTGLVVQPYIGARDDGLLGFVKGTGKGIGGFVLKDLAAILGPMGYTLKGIHKEIQRRRLPINFIRKARIIEGQRAAKALSDEERQVAVETVARGWKIVVEVRRQTEQARAEGLKGKWRARRQLREWREVGALENVDQAQRALHATKHGRDLETVFQGQREQLRKAEAPRKSTIGDPAEGRKSTEVAKSNTDGKDGEGKEDGEKPTPRSKEKQASASRLKGGVNKNPQRANATNGNGRIQNADTKIEDSSDYQSTATNGNINGAT